MKEKVNQFCNKLLEVKVGLRIIAVLSIIFFVSICSLKWKNHTFYYPEKEYQILEEEVKRLVNENEFSLDSKTEYECIIEYYNMQSNELKFSLTDRDYKLYRQYESNNKFFESIPLTVKANVKVDWEAQSKVTACEAEKEITIKRNYGSAKGYILSQIILDMILTPILLATIIGCLIEIIAIIVEFCTSLKKSDIPK